MYPNVSIFNYTIHGSYGLVNGGVFLRFRFVFFFYVIYSDVPGIHTPNLSQHTPTAGWFNTQGGRFARWYTFLGCSASLEIWGLVAIVAGVIPVLSISIIYPNFNGFHEFSMVMPGGTPQISWFTNPMSYSYSSHETQQLTKLQVNLAKDGAQPCAMVMLIIYLNCTCRALDRYFPGLVALSRDAWRAKPHVPQPWRSLAPLLGGFKYGHPQKEK